MTTTTNLGRLCLIATVLGAGCAAPGEDLGTLSEGLTADARAGEDVFRHENFGGNGRACETCHQLDNNGTIDPAFIATLDPSDPLFRAIDSDDGSGSSYNALRTRATVNVTLRLPRYLRPCDDLTATEVQVRRSVPSVFNVGLEPVLNWDGNPADLQSQATGAIFTHFEPTRPPTTEELDQLAAFQETLFNRGRLRGFYASGNPPQLPPGETEAEQRGRLFYLPEGRCGVCHSGPMLNETSEFHPDVLSGVRSAGERTAAVLAGTVGVRPQPPRFWCVVNPAGQIVFRPPVPFPDPGIAVNTVPNRPGIIGGFKIPTLWGAADTAPYFHDGSALNIAQLFAHYNLFFQRVPQFGPPLTPQEIADATAYLHLLGVQIGEEE